MRLALLSLLLLLPLAACGDTPTQPRACAAPADTAWTRFPMVNPATNDTVWGKIAVLPC